MRKILLFLTLLGFSGLLSGQITAIKGLKGEFIFPQITSFSHSDLEVTERLDSTINETWSGTAWVLKDKQRYSYSKNGSTSTVIIQKRKPGSLWVDSLKTETTVNAAGLVTLEISYLYILNQWVPQHKSEKSYNEAGDLTLFIVSGNDESLGWVGSYKAEFFYVGADFSSEIIYSGYTSGWEKISKYEYSKTDGKLTQVDRYIWGADEWKKTHRHISSYNSAGGWIREVVYEYNPLSYIYTEISKAEFTQNNNGYNITQVNYYRVTTFLGERLWQKNDSISNAWDSRGRNTYHANYIWDIPGGFWYGEWKNQITYSEIPVSHSVDITFQWNLSTWTNYSKSTSYYSSTTTGLTLNTEIPAIHAYPNPASEYVEFAIPQNGGTAVAELFDYGGRKVLRQVIPEDGRIMLNNLPEGLYIYRITFKGNVSSGKIVIK